MSALRKVLNRPSGLTIAGFLVQLVVFAVSACVGIGAAVGLIFVTKANASTVFATTAIQVQDCAPGQSLYYTAATSTLACTGSTPPPVVTAPGSCSIAQVPNTNTAPVAVGTSVALTMSCATGSPVTTCAWTGIAGSACAATVAPGVTTLYTATASNAGGTSPLAGANVQIIPPIPVPPNYCSGADQIINIPWPATGQVRPVTSGFNTQRIAFKVTIPTTFSPPLTITHLGSAGMAEAPAQAPTFREVTVSTSPCDFQSGKYLFSTIGQPNTAPSIDFTVNNPTGYQAAGGKFNANGGDVIYFNVRNIFNGVNSCSYAVCDMLFDFQTPNRY